MQSPRWINLPIHVIVIVVAATSQSVQIDSDKNQNDVTPIEYCTWMNCDVVVSFSQIIINCIIFPPYRIADELFNKTEYINNSKR